MRIIIAGGRDFDDYELLKEKCNWLLQHQPHPEIVSGEARGADNLGLVYAKEYGFPVHKFPANWKDLGRSAGYIRNKEMANFADALFAFWDGSSKGTKHMIKIARDKGLKVRVMIYRDK